MLQKGCNFSLYHTHPCTGAPHELRSGILGPWDGIHYMVSITFAFCYFCIHLHQEKTLRTKGQKIKTPCFCTIGVDRGPNLGLAWKAKIFHVSSQKQSALVFLVLLESWWKHHEESRLRKIDSALPSDFWEGGQRVVQKGSQFSHQ